MDQKRALLYCRTAHSDLDTLEMQKVYLTNYAEGKGFIVTSVVVEHGSGLDYSRTGLCEIMEAVEAGEVDVLLVQDFSRLGRDSQKTDGLLCWLKAHDVNVVCADGTDPQTFGDILKRLLEAYTFSCPVGSSS